MIILRSGDVFSCPPTYSFAHCISADAKMSRGIAAQFVRKFPDLALLRERKNLVGTAAVVPVGPIVIYNLVSKTNFWKKPSLETLSNCLQSMLSHALANKITDISAPKIGCGLDQLNFSVDVFPLIKNIFRNSTVTIHVYITDNVPRYVRSFIYISGGKVVELVLWW